MYDSRPAFRADDLIALEAQFPADDVELHDGALVISRRPDRSSSQATRQIVRSLGEYLVCAPNFRLESHSQVRFDRCNVRRFSLVLWELGWATPSFVVLVLSRRDRLRWARGRVNRALELGVRRALLVDPTSRELTVFEGVERTAVGESIGYDRLPGWSLSKAAIFAETAENDAGRTAAEP